jgi:hypothetical protein
VRGVLAALSVGLVMVVATVTSYVVAPSAGFAADQTATAVATLGVVIPASGSATPTPTPSTSSTGGSGTGTGGGGTTGGGSTGGGTTELPTQADGTPIPPDQPTKDAEDLKVDKESVSANEWIVATGTGFTPGEKVQFVLYPGKVIIGTFTADATGTVIARFKITDQARPGVYVVEATGYQSFRVANAEFRVVSPGDAGTFPWLWWVLVVLGVLLASLIATAVYFRHTIRSWFAGGAPVPGGA